MTRRRLPVAAAAALACLVAGAPALAQDDEVEISSSAPAVVQKGAKLKVSVDVRAKDGALDIADGTLHVQVRVAPACGASYATTTGTTVIDTALSPAPEKGKAYSATFSGTAKLKAYGAQSVCAFLDQEDGLQLASDSATAIDVSKKCTKAHTTLNAARKRLATLRRKHAKRSRITAQQRTIKKARAKAISACRG